MSTTPSIISIPVAPVTVRALDANLTAMAKATKAVAAGAVDPHALDLCQVIAIGQVRFSLPASASPTADAQKLAGHIMHRHQNDTFAITGVYVNSTDPLKQMIELEIQFQYN